MGNCVKLVKDEMSVCEDRRRYEMERLGSRSALQNKALGTR
jgi:hypothetical protein